ncbi:MAG: hypothetical protein U0452_02030 [Anaerolineae bacterium]
MLVVMVPAQYMGWLGTDLGYRNRSLGMHNLTHEYLATVEDYGLEAEVVEFQYATWVEGTIQAAEYVGASEVYADAPPALWKPVSRLLAWAMERQLQRQGRIWVH